MLRTLTTVSEVASAALGGIGIEIDRWSRDDGVIGKERIKEKGIVMDVEVEDMIEKQVLNLSEEVEGLSRSSVM